jgi:hypothetical protein
MAPRRQTAGRKISRGLWAAMRMHERNQERRKKEDAPPPGHFLLKGKGPDGSYTILHGLSDASTYLKLAGQ